MTALTDLVRQRALTDPDGLAVVDVTDGRSRTWTWHELADQTDRAASALLRLGVRPGEPVMLQLPNIGELVVLCLATLRIGAVCCPVMPIFREREMEQVLRRARPRVLVVPDEFRGRDHMDETEGLVRTPGRGEQGRGGSLEHVVVVAAEGSGHRALPAPDQGPAWHSLTTLLAEPPADASILDDRRPADDCFAQLMFTSGTSGEPKGVLHRADTLGRAAAATAARLRLTERDRVHVAAPMAHHSGFLYGMWLSLLLGTTQVLQPVWEARTALRALREWGGTFIQAATPFLMDLVTAVERGAEPASGLRMFVVTGAAVPRALAERASRVLGASVCTAWGSTETCMGTLSAPDDDPALVWGTDGRPLDGVELRIVDGLDRQLPRGIEGNLIVRSAFAFTGYFQRPEWDTEIFTTDGWYRTGDLAVLERSGYLRITGRVKDVINRGGEKVPVSEIEQVLYRHPAVEDVAVVAMPDDRLGERACAFVVETRGRQLDFPEMQRHLNEAGVAKHYWPEQLQIITKLPRNAAGKVQKFVLREQARGLKPLTTAANEQPSRRVIA
ncbi:AMP-binding protein [Streptomyces sp. NPDC007856]|uniref:AMP-binding protein n=1 Tax=Streptomyces sp. NPDC007856 TaxID=3364781 RepID=UPI0036D0B702